MAKWMVSENGMYHNLLIGGVIRIQLFEYDTDTMLEICGDDAEAPLEKWADSITLEDAKLEAVRWAKEVLEQMVKECEDALSLDAEDR